MATKSKKITGIKKGTAPKASKVPTAKAVAAAAVVAEAKGQPAPAAVKAAVSPAAKPAPASAPAKAAPVAAKPAKISKSERLKMIEQAAYYQAEKHGFGGDSSAHWAAAEAEIDADLKRRGVTVV